MGNTSSTYVCRDPYSANDFEMVIRLSKDLEYVLTEYFFATGNSLGE